MEISFLIVTKNRATELQFTLDRLVLECDFTKHEILVYIDGCLETEKIKEYYPQIRWFSNSYTISASPSRNFLYKQAKGEFFIGLDDDAHLISNSPIETVKQFFNKNQSLGIIAFLEIKGLIEKPEKNLIGIKKEEFLTTEFIGCGFAIRKTIYDQTSGFPNWIDIYGEESCLSIEVMNLGYDILFTNQVAVNHRVDIEKRKLQGKNYFRFQKQLQNSFRIYMVYYRKPFPRILRLLCHNFKKYGTSDSIYFKLYFRAIGNMIWNIPRLLKRRKKMDFITDSKLKTLKGISF
ncbi:glycosyltransferase family 2 protein [Flavobacterium sp. TAB 87]|uniref:glycosyltransferase family 2 protein n=1 Tax=Flavobacterium sp. TAB 87 TaxID=1729581 RepID=UPI00076DCCA4|nr:glycosyltransferase [Flavobacterium sp. TAB 87]KVV15880.1 Glycosyl transferase family 2 [Flavobacterium sp. TAB 87]